MAEWTTNEDGNPQISHEDGTFRIVPVPAYGKRIPPGFVIEELDTRYRFADPNWERNGTRHDSVALAKNDVASIFAHRKELKGFNRQERSFGRGRGRSTPWGKADSCTTYARGVQAYGTPSHGGFLLSKSANEQVHPAWRNEKGAYEEDSEANIVVITFPALFTRREQEMARRAAMNGDPHRFMAATGKDVPHEASRKLREEAFLEIHKGCWMVVSASGRDDGMVVVTATVDGVRDANAERRTFLVPKDDYVMTEGHFVVDLTRHAELEAESTFTP
jgi:hypothetical protein